MQKNSLSIQDKIESLDQLVAWFNGDDFQLEQAAIKLKEAAKLVSEIETDLQSVANEVKIVKQSFSESDS
jgi:exonuclease VII small subunit